MIYHGKIFEELTKVVIRAYNVHVATNLNYTVMNRLRMGTDPPRCFQGKQS
jgi:hypothetical protein